MSDILIKGMKMPKKCKSCRFCGFGGRTGELNVCMFTGESQPTLSPERMRNCPLVEVPPHGRLIDADALLSLDRQIYDGEIAVGRREYIFCFEVEDAPTIIPAEEGE